MYWETSREPVGYEEAVARMESHVAAMAEGREGERVWLLEHPPLYTAGASARDEDLIEARFPVFKTGRGGQHTYHGPGQRVAYVMLDLKKRGGDVRGFVQGLENWLIATLAAFGVKGETKEGRIGVWVNSGESEAKIAALGVRVRRGITYHGVSLNVHPDLSHYSGIVPCGIKDYDVTSLAALGINATMDEVDAELKRNFDDYF